MASRTAAVARKCRQSPPEAYRYRACPRLYPELSVWQDWRRSAAATTATLMTNERWNSCGFIHSSVHGAHSGKGRLVGGG
jgi:hypothetical protein